MEQHRDLARGFVKGDRMLCDQLWACTFFFNRSFLNRFVLKSIMDNNKAPGIFIRFYFYKNANFNLLFTYYFYQNTDLISIHKKCD